MKRLWLAIPLLFALTTNAFGAACTPGTCAQVITSMFDHFAGTNFTSGVQQLGPYVANVCGNISCGSITVNSSTGVPWNSNPAALGYYATLVPGGVSIPNFGTGLFLNFGNPHRVTLISFWMRYSGSLSTSPFFLRWNDNDNPAQGTDFATTEFDASGHIFMQSTVHGSYGASSNTVSANTWHLMEICTDWGTGGSNVAIIATVDGVNFLNLTGQATAAKTATNQITLDNEFSTATFDFGPMVIGDPGSCSTSTLYGSSGKLYATNFVPNQNASPLTWTPSTGTNYSNVNSNPAGANSNSTATVGNIDLFGFNGSVGTIVAMSSVASVKKDATSSCVAIPVDKTSGVTSTATVTNAVPGLNNYNFIVSVVAGTVLPTNFGIELVH